MVFLLRWWVVAAVGAWAAASFGADSTMTVSRSPPDAYTRAIAPLLTPLSAVEAGRTEFAPADADGVTLLSEFFHFRDTDGTLYRAQHFVLHARAASAVSSLANAIHRFDQERESIFLVEATTILPDGTRIPVAASGAFIQSPQNQSASSLYTSQAELNVIFGQVSPGAMTEIVIVIRENVPVMRNEFATHQTFVAGWPIYRQILSVDLPAAEWDRVRILTTGGSLPEPVSVGTEAGRKRLVWQGDRQPRALWEESAPSSEYIHPTVWLTTLPDWDSVAKWFYGLAAERSELGPDLTAEVDRLTQGLTREDDIVAALHAAVANEVRYTGLEFGLAGYQPYPCAHVWQRRYGDCKDKANLLRAMLAHKGIRSSLALINTEALGRVERGSPSWRQFNHVILALGEGTDAWRYCDPSIKHLPAGELGMSDRGRDLLIVGANGARWAHTPPTGADAIDVSLALKLSSEGDLSGWFTLVARGSDGAFYTEYFNGQERRDRIRAMQQLVESFVPGAEVPDIEYTPVPGTTREFQLRAFLRRPARIMMGEPILFPLGKSWLPELTTVGERRLPYALAPREQSVEAAIELPSGMAPVQLPAEFAASATGGDLRAKWEMRDGKLQARLRWRPPGGELAPSDYAPLQKALRTLTAWLAQPVIIRTGSAGGDHVPAAAARAFDPLAGFERLPTGEGQLRLIEELFPEGRNDAVRRQAIERMLAWFPDDVETTFTGKVSLLRIDPNFSPRVHAVELRQLVASHGAKVPAGTRAWAEFLAAQWEWQAAKSPAAIDQMRKMAAETSLPMVRRSWAAFEAARYLGETKPKEAAAALTPWAETTSEAQLETVALLAALHFRANNLPALIKTCDERIVRLADATAAWERTLGYLQADWTDASVSTRDRTLAFLDGKLRHASTSDPIKRRLANLRSMTSATEIQKTATRDLAAWLKAHPPTWWTRKKDPKLSSPAQAWERVREATNKRDTSGAVDASLQVILHHAPSFDEFVRALGLATWRIHYDEARGEEPLFGQLALIADRLPPAASSTVLSLWSTIAKHRVATGREKEARPGFEKIARSEFATPTQRLDALGEIAMLDWRQGDIGGARTAFQSLRDLPGRSVDSLFAACLMEHEQGNLAAVADWAHELARSTPAEVAESANAPVIEALTRGLRDNPEGMKHYWARTATWRGEWRRFVAAVAPDHASWNELPLGLDWNAQETRLARLNHGRDVPSHVRLLNQEARLLALVPAGALSFLQHVGQFTGQTVGQRRQILTCGLRLVENLAPVNPDFDDAAQLWEAILLTELEIREEGVRKARELHERLGGASAVGQSAARIWATACRSDAGRRAAADALEKILNGDAPVTRRLETVAVLVDLLAALRESSRMTSWLERETARSDFDRTSAAAKPLLAKLSQLRGDPSDPSRFSNYVKAWSAAPENSWLGQLKPSTLEDPRFASFRDPMLETQTGFNEAERLKFNLLLALDDRQSLLRRESAFCQVLWDTAFATNDYETLAARFRAALQNPALSAPSKSSLLQQAIRVAVSRRHLELLTLAKSQSTYPALPESIRTSTELAWTALDLLQVSPDLGPKRAFQTLVEKPLDAMRQNLAQSILQQLVMLGRAAEADALLAATQGIAADPTSGTSAPAIRLNWTRAVRAAKEAAPFVNALSEQLLAYPEARDSFSTIAQRQIDLRTPLLLTEAEGIALVAQRMRTRGGLPGNLGLVFAALRRNAVIHQAQPSLAVRVLPALLEGPISDSLRSAVFRELTAFVDIDDPAERAVFEAAIARLTEPSAASAQPLTAEAAATLRASIALRSSNEERPAALFDPALTRSIPPDQLRLLQLRFYASRELNAPAAALFDEMQSETLAGGRLFPIARQVLTRSQRADELALHKEAMRDTFERNLGMLWYHPGRGDGAMAAYGSYDDGDFKLALPDGWFEHALGVTRSNYGRAQLEFYRARQNEKWKEALRACDELIRRTPRLYDRYWDRALVHAKLGEKAKARADLAVFLRYCRDHPEYPRARQLVRDLEASNS